MSASKTNPKDLEGSFDKIKQFKAQFPEADNDSVFKTCYTRMRKYNKKLKRIYETLDKAGQNADLTEDQAEMINTRNSLEILFDEVLSICETFMESYRKQAEGTPVEENKEEVDDNTEQVQPPEPEEAPKQPEIDVQAIKDEAYGQGYSEGDKAGYEKGKAEGYEQGKEDGYSQAKQEQPEVEPESPAEILRKVSKFATTMMVLPVFLNPM